MTDADIDVMIYICCRRRESRADSAPPRSCRPPRAVSTGDAGTSWFAKDEVKVMTMSWSAKDEVKVMTVIWFA